MGVIIGKCSSQHTRTSLPRRVALFHLGGRAWFAAGQTCPRWTWTCLAAHAEAVTWISHLRLLKQKFFFFCHVCFLFQKSPDWWDVFFDDCLLGQMLPVDLEKPFKLKGCLLFKGATICKKCNVIVLNKKTSELTKF